jgi:PAS domain S-box-containing protein
MISKEERLLEQVSELKRRIAELENLQVAQLCPSGIMIHVEERIRFGNAAWARIHGVEKPDELYGLLVTDLVHPDDRERVINSRPKPSATLGGSPCWLEHRLIRADGSPVDAASYGVLFKYQGQHAIMVFVEDISQRKQAEEALKQRESELSSKSGKLEETNTALKVLLRHRDEDKRALESTIITNVRELVFPFIEKIRNGRLSDNQYAYLDIIESGLNEIISPFLQKMTGAYARFTPMEIQVANLVKNGKTTKEIAELLNIGTATVDSHRNSIRGKLGLRNSRSNLQTHLLSL